MCFLISLHKVPHTTKPSFRLIPTQLRSSPSLPPFEVRAPIFHCRLPVCPSLQLSRHTALIRPRWRYSALEWPSSTARGGQKRRKAESACCRRCHQTARCLCSEVKRRADKLQIQINTVHNVSMLSLHLLPREYSSAVSAQTRPSDGLARAIKTCRCRRNCFQARQKKASKHRGSKQTKSLQYIRV